MDLVEFVMCQRHIAEKIFAQLDFQQLISFSKASISCHQSATGYLRRLKSMKIVFSKFCEPGRQPVNSFLAGNTDLRHLSVVIDGSQDETAMSALCWFVLKFHLIYIFFESEYVHLKINFFIICVLMVPKVISY